MTTVVERPAVHLARTRSRARPLPSPTDPRGLRVADLDAARQATVLQVISVLARTLGPSVGMPQIYRHWDRTYLGRVAGTGGAELGWWFRVQNPALCCDFDSDDPDLLGPDVVIPVARGLGSRSLGG